MKTCCTRFKPCDLCQELGRIKMANALARIFRKNDNEFDTTKVPAIGGNDSYLKRARYEAYELSSKKS